MVDPQDEKDTVVTTAEVYLERLRLNDALSARDAVVQHLAEACTSIRQKTATILLLEQEKADLETQLSFMTGRQSASQPGGRADRAAREREYVKVQVEVGSLAEMFRRLERENQQLKAQITGEQLDATARPSDWQVALHRILRLVMPAPNVEVNLGHPNDGRPVPTTAPGNVPPANPSTSCARVDHGSLASVTAPPDERFGARNAILAALPLTPDVPADVLKPIVIPPQYTFQDFVTTLPNTTFWSTEREEHGYFLTPLFKCTTNPRATTAHRWAAVDLSSQLNKTTDCFFNKNGYWYYTGLYKAFWLDELSPAEWGNLTSETTQALVKQTIFARKNTAPQNVYETGQLYSAGALRVACIGLQCIGFSHAVYTQLIEAAEKCAQTGCWRNTQAVAGTGPGSIWTPPSPTLSPRALSTISARSTARTDDCPCLPRLTRPNLWVAELLPWPTEVSLL
ncbi:uncharacterized protein B0H18DRAFT_872652 [Fomitopsis serialis]|uniref:uncharacterized protein n=1 Tax=Fomitopsis serialis TaxID=139415 RepID=UPI0020078970|nr:uncharacterized protein B0H18DRAFT_872652 [Neoantrodia serialis]KAH9930845.1 hypothetical protein B0H18DRAFT_872652 [Neoantrodia serialis]